MTGMTLPALVSLMAFATAHDARADEVGAAVRREIHALDRQLELAKDTERASLHDGLRTVNAGFSRAQTAYELGKEYLAQSPRLALQYFTIARTTTLDSDVLNQAARLEILKLKLSWGEYQDVLTEIGAMEKIVSSNVIERGLLETAMKAHHALKDTREFLRRYDQYASRVAIGIRDEAILRQAADAFAAAGEEKRRFQLLETLAQVYPATALSRWAFGELSLLREAGEYTFSLEMMRKLNRFADVDESLKAQLENMVESDALQLSGGVTKTLGPLEKIHAYVRLREYAKALRMTEELASATPIANEVKLVLTGWLARLNSLNGRYEEADRHFRSFFAAAPESRHGAMLEAHARNLAKLGRHRDAAARFGELARLTGSRTARQQEFWHLYQAGDHTRAWEIMRADRSVLTADPMEPMAARFWEGRMLERAGKFGEARKIYREIVTMQPDSYYASVILSRHSQEKWQTGVTFVAATSAAGVSYPRVRAFTPNAAREMSLWKASYPLAFDAIVSPMAEVTQLDKFLILSIMRAESYYNPDATSHVGARGLMQLMPYTAIRVAGLIGDQDFDVERLTDPTVNVGYAAYYLRQLMAYYGGNYFLAIAAYNAGPQAVDSWIANCGGQTNVEEFVEMIPYDETRRYVKKVVRYYAQYRRIHLDASGLPEIPQELAAQDAAVATIF